VGFWAYISLSFFRSISSSSSQHRVRQRTEEGQAATMAKVANKQALTKRNVLKADIMRPPLDFIAEIIEANHWRYLYTSASPVYPMLVREFYKCLEIVQDDDHRIIL
jgi:hypothetical protein